MLLHGFAGTGRAWEPVVDRLGATPYLAPDLRGASFDACVADVLDATPGRFSLVGYSMGGRIALHVALAAPQRVERLVLVATTAGIDDDAERRERRRADEALADWTQEHTIEQFADRWSAQPLFAGTPPEAAAWWRADLLRNDPRTLAAMLRGIGTGAMAPLWPRLPTLTMPAEVVVGERDAKFRAIADRLTAALGGPTRLHVVPGAGHGLPREAPAELAAILLSA